MPARTAAAPQPAPPTEALRPAFASDAGFLRELKRRVDEHFVTAGGPRRGGTAMHLKTFWLLSWLSLSYGLLVFAANTLWLAIPLAFSLALAVAGVGFGVQHDANHEAYSERRWVNGVFGFMLDVLGASSYVWHWKHNVFHHTFTNVSGADDDIDVGPLARLAPAQARRPVHRWQSLYMWVLYGFLLSKWQLFDDARNVITGRISLHTFPRPKGASLLRLLAGKAVFFTWSLAIPLLMHPWWVVASFWLATSFVAALVLSVVFQVAHCTGASAFRTPDQGKKLSVGWAVHQVESTANFAPRSRSLTWYLGGLNFQIEHHLFPKTSHLHYPRLSPIVQRLCEERGIRYHVHSSFASAIAAHGRWLSALGSAT